MPVLDLPTALARQNGRLCYKHANRRVCGAGIEPDVVRFLQHLLDQVQEKLLVVWDGLPIHPSRAVKEFLAAGAAQRLWLGQLPGYAPEN
jgi:hypothetical protein